MLPPFSGVDLVRVMRAEMDINHRKAEHHLPFESAEDFEDERGGSGSQKEIRGLRRLLQLVPLVPGRTRT